MVQINGKRSNEFNFKERYRTRQQSQPSTFYTSDGWNTEKDSKGYESPANNDRILDPNAG